MAETTWTGSLHQTFRFLGTPSPSLIAFLKSDGQDQEHVLAQLPYDVGRAKARGGTDRVSPDPKRYRDSKQVYQTVGLVYEDDNRRLKVTPFGQATLRWAELINEKNCPIFLRHAAFALSACQLRNPSGSGNKYDDRLEVFPFQFVWRAMLGLDGRISSEEMNRAMFRVTNADELLATIEAIRGARATGDPESLGPAVVTGEAVNDRIIPWLSLASFGWSLFSDKEDGYYRLRNNTYDLVAEAARIHRKHKTFNSVQEYVESISTAACLPKDLR